jgi:hypothetical protein
MERLVQPWKLLFVVCGAVVALGAGASALKAETANPFPTNGNTNSNQDLNNVFNNSGDSSSLYGLINRLQLMNGRSSGDFAAEQNEGFQSAVDEYRKKQQQQQLQGPTPQKPATAPSQNR